MDHYLWLAREQHKRLEQFRAEHPELNTPDARQEFYAQRYEARIAGTIVEGISECEKYNENHPVKA